LVLREGLRRVALALQLGFRILGFRVWDFFTDKHVRV
jgi:hypothetical protein